MARYKKIRISLSLPENLVDELNNMVVRRGWENRSQAVAEMIESQITEHKESLDNEIMAGTVTLIYDRQKNLCQQKLADLQVEYAKEVISSLHINLEEQQIMEVIIVQGPARKLQIMTDQMLAVKGVKTGKLNLNTSILPPLHKREDA